VPTYISPEQARGEGNRVDGRRDIFSLGIVPHALLTGRRPFSTPILRWDCLTGRRASRQGRRSIATTPSQRNLNVFARSARRNAPAIATPRPANKPTACGHILPRTTSPPCCRRCDNLLVGARRGGYNVSNFEIVSGPP
jgi:serine/threonine protein kinase